MNTTKKIMAAGLAIYCMAALYLHFTFQIPFSDFYGVIFIIGICFSLIAWQFTKNIPAHHDKPLLKNEIWLIALLVAWITFYITYGGSLLDKLFPPAWLQNPKSATVLIFAKKLFVFVIIPFTIYTSSGFTLKDFGLKNTEVKFPGRKTMVVFILLSVAAVLFQYFAGNGSKPIRTGQFSSWQLITGVPLCFVYLFFDAGFIEEFFFRGWLQSRLSLLLKSSASGIVCTAIIFGLVHAPGLFLRGAESEGMGEQMPFLFWAAYTIVYMGVAGIFLGIVYNKTKNLYLVIAIHAMFDLLPNLPEFIETWHL